MNTVKTSLMAAALLLSTALPSAAITNAEVLTAMNTRIGELSVQVSALEAQLPGATPANAAFLQSQIQALVVRRAQLVSLLRIVPRYNERFLIQIVTHYDLDVSLA